MPKIVNHDECRQETNIQYKKDYPLSKIDIALITKALNKSIFLRKEFLSSFSVYNFFKLSDKSQKRVIYVCDECI